MPKTILNVMFIVSLILLRVLPHMYASANIVSLNLECIPTLCKRCNTVGLTLHIAFFTQLHILTFIYNVTYFH